MRNQDFTATSDGITTEQIMVEPPANTPEWLPSVYRRLFAAYRRPVAVDVQSDALRARLELAGWPLLSKGTFPLEGPREAAWPNARDVQRIGGSFGSLRPSIVLVGEQQKEDRIHLFDDGGAWLFNALRLLGHDELTIHLATSIDHEQRSRTDQLAELHRALCLSRPMWIAMGKKAHRICKAAKIPFRSIVHPDYHRRYYMRTGHEGYAEILEKIGVERRVQVVGVDGPLPDLPKPYDFKEAWSKKKRHQKTKIKTGADAVKREQARRLYVTGKVKNLEEAAKAVDVNPRNLRHSSQNDSWVAEREEYQRQVTEEAKRKASHAEVRAIVNSKRLAWACTEMSLGKLTRKLQGEFEPTIFEVKAIASIALAMSGAEGLATQADGEVVQKTLPELMTAIQKRVDALGG